MDEETFAAFVEYAFLHVENEPTKVIHEVKDITSLFKQYDNIGIVFKGNNIHIINIDGKNISTIAVKEENSKEFNGIIKFIKNIRPITGLNISSFPNNAEYLHTFSGDILELSFGSCDDYGELIAFLKNNPQLQSLEMTCTKKGSFGQILAAIPGISAVAFRMSYDDVSEEFFENIPPHLKSIKAKVKDIFKFFRCMIAKLKSQSQITTLEVEKSFLYEEEHDPNEYAELVNAIVRMCPNMESFICKDLGDSQYILDDWKKLRSLDTVISRKSQIPKLSDTLRNLSGSLRRLYLEIVDGEDCPEFRELIEILCQLELQ